MAHVPLSPKTASHLEVLFTQADRDEAERFLVESCGSGLPFQEDASPESLERLRFAALKLSGGDLSSLLTAIELANTDWRDLLMSAGFADDVHTHESWDPAADA